MNVDLTALPGRADAGGTVVRVEGGLVAGHGSPVRVFKAVPYAAPPVGDRRWQPPAPIEPWDGVRPGDEWGEDCPQAPTTRTRAPRMGEDCLTLNIWAPADPADGQPGPPRPVMVWLFGGGYMAGSASDPRCDGEGFAREGVVTVAVGYRVGVFGFLAHPELTRESPHGASGNQGLLDIVAALQWVQRNIAAFGGDPAAVTLFGVSAGSASISLLLASPLARGLFARTVQQSPGAFRRLASLADAEAAGARLGSDLAALRRLSAEEVLAKTPLFVPKMRGLTTPRVLRPIRDGWVIPADERDAHVAGTASVVPSIVGGNEDEGTKLTAGWSVGTDAELDALFDESFGPAAAQAREAYADERAAGNVRACVAALFADTQFNYGVRGVSRAIAARGVPVWQYLFRQRRPGAGAPNHGEGVPYVFRTLPAAAALDGTGFGPDDETVAAAMQAAWVRFARTGDPNGEGAPEWPRTGTEERILVFGPEGGVTGGWRGRQLDFLDRFFGSGGTA